MLEDLAEARRVGEGVVAETGPDVEVVLADDRPDRVDDLADRGLDVGRRRPSAGLVRDDPDRREDRVDEAVQPLDLVQRRVVPGLALGAAVRVARLAALERRIVGEELRVGPDDGERRPQLVGDEGDQLAAGLVDLAQLLEPRLGLGLLAALLDDARRGGRRSRRAGRRRPSVNVAVAAPSGR